MNRVSIRLVERKPLFPVGLFTMLRFVKEHSPSTRVIVITGYSTVSSAVEVMKLGAFDYLLKPAYFEDLTAKLEAARKRKDEQEERVRRAEAKLLLRKSGDI
mgnify:CR=1 FL=1